MGRAILMAAAAALLAAVPARAQAPSDPAPVFAKLPDGRKLAFFCVGSGAPTIVLDSGAGGPAVTWRKVQGELARTNRTCAYNRAGYVTSDPGPLPRTARRVVDDLRQGLAALGEKPPYVLVGHSIAGFHVRLYANLHPDEVAAMVLVDPSTDGGEAPLIQASAHFAKMYADDDEGGHCAWAIAQGQLQPGTPLYAECGSPPPGSYLGKPEMAQAVISEVLSQLTSTAQVAASKRSYGRMPLIVLTHDIKVDSYSAAWPPEERTAYMNAVLDSHKAMAALSARGRERVVPGANHVIQYSQPQAVIDAVHEVLAELR
jgi:pimeloyl-ACP methyl ester carboxylesterase